ncbi:hypothetical protein JY96_21145 [Aquabacterium sp. NJ1]|nr:hypothetical protein JY96_21145 [Aquabacterium sp. NJ1]
MSITLKSTGYMGIAKLIQWATQGYAEALHKRESVGVFIALLADGYGLSPVLAEKVLRGEVSYCQVDRDVTLLLDPDETDNYLHRQSAIEGHDIPRPVLVSEERPQNVHH